jgi:hypothetical protein
VAEWVHDLIRRDVDIFCLLIECDPKAAIHDSSRSWVPSLLPPHRCHFDHFE